MSEGGEARNVGRFWCVYDRWVVKRAVSVAPGCDDFFHEDDGSLCRHVKFECRPEGGEARNYEAGIEAAELALAALDGLSQPTASHEDTVEVAVTAYLDAVRCSQGRATDTPAECRVNLVSSRMCERGTKGCEVEHGSPQGEDHETAMSAARQAFLDASTLRLLPAQWEVLAEKNLPAAVAAYRKVLAGDHDQGAHE